MQTPKNYVKNPKGENHGAKRELNQRDYNEFSMLYSKFNSLGFDLVQRRKRSAIAEG